MLKRCLLFAVSLLIASSATAQSLGVVGQVYSIAEPDLLRFIHARLALFQREGKLTQLQHRMVQQARQAILTPTPVAGVTTTQHARTFTFTPRYTVKQTRYDAQGHVLLLKGTTINPLDPKNVAAVAPFAHAPHFDQVWLFFNGREANQVRWAQTQAKALSAKHQRFKLILTAGNVATASKQLGRVYFDLDGTLCHHFGIHTVPARLHQTGDHLVIEEVTTTPQGVSHETA